jgi:L-fuculose-phosphate aldolase
MKDNVDTAGMAGEIMDTCRVMMSTGLVVGTWGNVSRRCSTEDFLITPSGVPYNELQPGDLVVVNLQTGSCSGSLCPSTETPLHAAIYRRRPDVEAIIHTHSPYAAVFAVNRIELPPLLEEIAQLVGGSVRVAPYAASGSIELAEGAAAAIQDRFFVLSGYLITDLLVAEWQENGRRYSRPASSSSEVARQAGYDLLLMMQWVAQEIQGS